MTPVDVVETADEADGLNLAPLLVLQSVEDYLDGCGLGEGPVTATRIGEGRSNVTYLIERGGARLVLRRPPRPPMPPSAHDVVREARVQKALERAGAPVPHVVDVCEDESVLGVPFYLTEFLDGYVVGEQLPAALDTATQRRRIGLGLVDALADIHAVDWEEVGLAGFGRPTGYLERQLRRWSDLWKMNATRELPAVAELGNWLEANRPEPASATVVHGDYRLGNVMLSPDAPARVLAVLDWELSTIGDPLADVGYLIATYSEPGSPRTPLELSPVTAAEGFPSRMELSERYSERSGASLEGLPWYEALALWKASVFCEEIYGRYLRGEHDDPWAASLSNGVPRLLDVARESAARL
jgi:aminoglycoside phosphotransferase (APT) family kinase protein